jgi:hypothetical protein
MEGVELNSDTLDRYKLKFCNEANVPREDEGILSQILGKFFSLNKSEQNKTLTDKQVFCSQINNAITIRTAINAGKIEELKSKNYSENQKTFKESLDKFNDKFTHKISETILDYSEIDTMNLNKISEFINNLQTLLQIREDVNVLTNKDNATKTQLQEKLVELELVKNFPVDSIPANIQKEIDDKIGKIGGENTREENGTSGNTNNLENSRTKQGKNNTAQSSEPAQNNSTISNQPNINADIIQYLKGDELKKEKLVEYKTKVVNDNTLKTSIDLCLKFWDLVQNSNKKDDFTDLLDKQIKKNDRLKDSELKTFLESICKDSNAFNKFNNARGKAAVTTLTQLKDKVK